MGKVLVAIKVNPADDKVNLDELVAKIKEGLKSQYEIVKHEKIYVAFGLYALRLYVLMPEELEGGTEELENYLKSFEGVSSVDVELVTRTEAFG